MTQSLGHPCEFYLRGDREATGLECALEFLRRGFRPGPPGAGEAPFAFPIVYRSCMVRLYVRAGCLTTKNDGFPAREVGLRGEPNCLEVRPQQYIIAHI